ncbi:hypothetical protein JCM18899A_32690 [Nocardioides sp. AN3]
MAGSPSCTHVAIRTSSTLRERARSVSSLEHHIHQLVGHATAFVPVLERDRANEPLAEDGIDFNDPELDPRHWSR